MPLAAVVLSTASVPHAGVPDHSSTREFARASRWHDDVTRAFGLGFVILFLAGPVALQGEPLSYALPPDRAIEYFDASGMRYFVGSYIGGVAFLLFFLPFVIGLRRVLEAAEGDPRIASRLAFAGGLALVTVGAVVTIFLDVVALSTTDAALEESTVRALLYANAIGIATITLPAALFTFAASAAIWNIAMLWRDLAVIGVLSGALLVLGGAFPLEGGPLECYSRFEVSNSVGSPPSYSASR